MSPDVSRFPQLLLSGCREQQPGAEVAEELEQVKLDQQVLLALDPAGTARLGGVGARVLAVRTSLGWTVHSECSTVR